MGAHNVSIILSIVITYVLLTVLLSLWTKKFTSTSSRFMTGGRDMGAFVIGVLMMSEFIGTAATMGTAEAAFGKGISAAWNLVSMCLAFILFACFMAPKFQRLGEYTISGAIATRYGEKVRLMTSVIMIYALQVVNVSMYVGGAATIATILHLPTYIATLITAAVTILYVAVGGIKGVAYTNLIHASIKYFGLIITTVVALQFSGGSLTHLREVMPPVYFSLTGVGLPTIIAWTIGNIGAVFSTQYVIQAIAAIKDEHKARKASWLAGLLMIPVGLMSAFIGVAAKYVFPQIKGVSAIPTLAARMDPWFGGLVIAGLAAAVFGSVSGVTLGSTALVMKDFYVPLVKPGEKHTLIASRIISIVIGLLPVPFAMLMPGVLKTIFFARALRTSIAIVATCMFFAPGFSSGTGAFWGLLLAALGASGWFFMGNPFGIDNIYVAAAIPLVVMMIDHVLKGAGSGPAVEQKTMGAGTQ
jgi:SSS family solute:Na+ symporter